VRRSFSWESSCKAAFGILKEVVLEDLLEEHEHKCLDELFGYCIALVQIDSADQGFNGIGQDIGIVSAAALVFAFAQIQVVAEIDPPGGLVEIFLAYQSSTDAGHFAFRSIGHGIKQVFGSHQFEYRITEELQAFVVIGLVAIFVEIGAVRQSQGEQ
jgi:hypothetical protein